MSASPPPQLFTSKRPAWAPRALHYGLCLASPAEASARSRCPSCDRSMALYCHECILPLAAETPAVLLPCRLFVITHAQQRLSNATGVHLQVLAPGQARLVSLEELPPLGTGAVVLFPSADSVPVDSLDLASVTDVIVIDSKWGQAKGVLAAAKLAGVRQVHLRDYRTSFWRYHTSGVPEEGLCTVEAVFFCFRELHSRAHAGEACHCFDNLLWLFAQQHALATARLHTPFAT